MYIKEKNKNRNMGFRRHFWSGNFEENSLQFIEKNIEILNILNNRGIINSICSKNDFEKIRNLLKRKQIWDLFVFPSINYSPKRKFGETNIRESTIKSRECNLY